MREHKSFIDFVQATEFSELTLATLVQTEGSSYKKAGARKIIAEDGSSIGLISGGCLEGEIVDKALNLQSGKETHSFDTTDELDRLFGYGTGCQGVLTIEFEKVPSVSLSQELQNWSIDRQLWVHVIGAGPDIDPLKGMLDQLGWHQRYYTPKKDLFEERLAQGYPIQQLKDSYEIDISYGERSAVLLMSHSYETDLHTLSQLTSATPRYVGILGPARRKDQMLTDLVKIYKKEFSPCNLHKIHGPMGQSGLGRGEQAIALSIVAQLQQIFFSESS